MPAAKVIVGRLSGPDELWSVGENEILELLLVDRNDGRDCSPVPGDHRGAS
jgi:hypothetical protein